MQRNEPPDPYEPPAAGTRPAAPSPIPEWGQVRDTFAPPPRSLHQASYEKVFLKEIKDDDNKKRHFFKIKENKI